MSTIQTLLETSDRAYANLYDITIIRNNGSSLDSSLWFRAEDINFGGDFSLETFYSDPTKQHFITGANRPKTISITFRETPTYKVMGTFRAWQSSIYQQSINAFLPGDPTGNITITLDPDNYTNNQTNGNTPVLKINNAIPSSIAPPTFSYREGNPLVTVVTFSIDDIDFITLVGGF